MTGNRRSLKWYKITGIMRGFCRVEYGKSCLGKHDNTTPVISPSSQVIKSGIIWGQAGSCAAPDVNCLFEKFLVSIITNFLPDGVGEGGIGPMPNPQPGGPGFSVRVAFP